VRPLLRLAAWLLVALTACQSAAPVALEPAPGATSRVTGTPAATVAPALGIDLRVPPTRAPRPSPAAAPAPASSPAAAASASPSTSATVTLANDGRTIMLRPGQRALVNLGDELDWTVQVDDDSIVSLVPGVTVMRGAQGIYQANRVGQTVLRATGEPVCRRAQPACAQPSRAFALIIAVQ
jgi:hypothetical protein